MPVKASKRPPVLALCLGLCELLLGLAFLAVAVWAFFTGLTLYVRSGPFWDKFSDAAGWGIIDTALVSLVLWPLTLLVAIATGYGFLRLSPLASPARFARTLCDMHGLAVGRLWLFLHHGCARTA